MTTRYTPSPSLTQRVENNFTYHRPFGDQGDRYDIIRSTLKSTSLAISTMVPESRELSLALTALEEACYWANAAIARNEVETVKEDPNE